MSESVVAFGEKKLDDLVLPHQVDVDPRTGALRASVTLPVTPGRNGFQPALTLAYSSSTPNSSFGLGWSLSGAPSVSLSLRRGLPRYDGTDTYAFGGADLCPAMAGSAPRIFDAGDHWVHVLRGGVETSFVRFERWVDKRTGRIHFLSRDRSGTLSIFGRAGSGTSRIADPSDPNRISEWLLEWQIDRDGNAIHYEYVPENFDNVDVRKSFEHARVVRGGSAQRYLRRVRYGNGAPVGREVERELSPDSVEWMYSLVFDHGERNGLARDAVPYETTTAWPVRVDPISHYRAGFEIRTYRLCRRIIQFHHFPDELGEAASLVFAFELHHDENPTGSTLESVSYTGLRRDRPQKSLPILQFRYAQARVDSGFQNAVRETLENVPVGLGRACTLVDLHGDGLPGLLVDTGKGWYYKENLGGGVFGTQRSVPSKPSSKLGSFALSDFDGDGNPNFVVFEGREAGHYELDRSTGRWSGFQPFRAAPRALSNDENTKLVDLDGDGRADIVTIEAERIVWHKSKGKDGFEPAREISRPRDARDAPTIGASPGLDLFFADMTGDGLPDQVRVRNGRIEYWPQLGNGRFGQRVVMEDAPILDESGAFDAARVRLVDLDGSGTADLLYLGKGEIRFWKNACGNRWIEGGRIGGIPYIDDLDSVSFADFLADGTTCLVWSTSKTEPGVAPLRYLRLNGVLRPRLLVSVESSAGREARVTYGHSSRHYLRDIAAGRGWHSRLPGHVVVVDRLDHYDRIGNTRFTSLYEYHDGTFDSGERAFRGFGLVDRYDSDAYTGSAFASDENTSTPSCTRTWFHDGSVGSEPRRSRDYYAADPNMRPLAGHVLEDLDDISAEEYVQAFRALAGQVVRTEVFAVERDGRRAPDPYQVSAARFAMRKLSPATERHDAVVRVYQAEALTYTYEQQRTDPRVTHTITHEVDDWGNHLLTSNVAYARREEHRIDVDAQARTEVSVSKVAWAGVDEMDRYEAGIPIESAAFELANPPLARVPGKDSIVDREALARSFGELLRDERVLAFDQPFSGGLEARRIAWQRMYYWDDARAGALELGDVGSDAVLHHGENAAFPIGMLEARLAGRVDASDLETEGSYVTRNGHYWQVSPTRHYAPHDRFKLLIGETRVVWIDGARTEANASYEYDRHSLFLVGASDALGNPIARARIDYVRGAPDRIVDANDNVREVRYDALGVVIVGSEHGTILASDAELRPIGNESLEHHSPVSVFAFEDVLREPERFLQDASSFFHYELDVLPPRSVSLTREERVHDGEGGRPAGRIQISVAYADGFGRTLQARERVGPGPAVHRRADGRLVLDESDVFDERWRVSSHVVYNEKQQVVRAYEPFFSATYEFESDAEIQTFGETIVTTYDAVGREIRVLYPNLTSSRVVHEAWSLRQYDPNDDVVGSPYATLRAGYAEGDPRRLPLESALAHADTPVIAHLDPRGRQVASVIESRSEPARRTDAELDSQGNTVGFTDARRLTAFVQERDMLGRAFHETSMDSGELWSFVDGENRARHVWDSRGVHVETSYDLLGRPKSVRVSSPSLDRVMTEHLTYGDEPGVPDAAARNLLGKLHIHRDAAGVRRIERYDPAGTELESSRVLVSAYERETDWSDPTVVALESETFVTRVRLDALGRLVRQELPDGSVRRFEYERGGGVARIVASTVDGALTARALLEEAVYNARGQRTSAIVGPALVEWEYDPATYELERLRSRAHDGTGHVPADARIYQDIRYAFDPVGNVVYLHDAAQEPGSTWLPELPESVEPTSTYEYDAFYQLRVATGRIHRALEAGDYDPNRSSPPDLLKGTRQVSLDDLSQVRRYTREYRYDAAGNRLELRHTTHARAGSASDRDRTWQTEYWVSGASNRSLPRESLDGTPISDPESWFDASGNTIRQAHLRAVRFGHKNQLASVVRISREGTGQSDDAEYYVYASDGRRVRKVTCTLEHGSLVVREKIYLDQCEIVRTRAGDTPLLERIVSHFGDGALRIATLHRWKRDALHTETDDLRPKLHFSLANHLGSVSLEIDPDGEVISYEEYFPFGGSAFIAGRTLRDVSLKDYRYSGKECDDTTGFYYYGQRYYLPWMGRWLNPDPIGPDDGLNLYGFVHGNPIVYVDPTGLDTVPVQVQIVRITEEQNERLHWRPGVLHAIVEDAEDPNGDHTMPGAVMFNSMAMASPEDRVMYVYDPEGEYLEEGTYRHGEGRMRISRNESGEIEYFVLIPSEFFSDASETGVIPPSTSATSSERSGAPQSGAAEGSGSASEGDGTAVNGQPTAPDGTPPGGSAPTGTAEPPARAHPPGVASPDGTSIYQQFHAPPPGEEDRLVMDVPGSRYDPPPEPHQDRWWDPIAEFVQWAFYFTFGVVMALFLGIVEILAMLYDSVAEVGLAAYNGIADENVDRDCVSSVGRMFETRDDAWSLLLDGIIQTPDRMADAMLYGRPMELGMESINVLMMVDGAGGLTRGVTRLGGRVRAAMVTPTARMLAADAAIDAELAAAAQSTAASDTVAAGEVAGGAEALGGETNPAAATDVPPAEITETAAAAQAAPEAPISALSEWDGVAELAERRTALGHKRGMLAEGRTDIPGMEGETYQGASRRAGGSSLPAEAHPTNPQNRTVQFGGQGSPHAEGDVVNQIALDIESRAEAGTLTEADLAGREVRVAVETNPCPCCRARHAGTVVGEIEAGQTAWTSALVQFSRWYPQLDLVITFPGGRLTFRAGEMVERIGIPGAADIVLH